MKKVEITTEEDIIILRGYNNNSLYIYQPFNPYTQENFKDKEECLEYAKLEFNFEPEFDEVTEDGLIINDRPIEEVQEPINPEETI